MNVIVSNRLKEITSSLDIDVMSVIEGTYSSEELVQKYATVFFNRMIIDITALKSKDFASLQKLSISFDPNKLIFLLEDIDMDNNSFISNLISLSMYNFATNRDAILYLYVNPNSYRDVASKHNSVQEALTVKSEASKKGPASINFDMFKINNEKEEITNNEFEVVNHYGVFPKVLGFRNMTEHAGATTLIYMLHKELSKYFSVAAVEIDKSDFLYLAYENFYSTTSLRINTDLQKLADCDVILIDLNNYESTSLCDEVICLVEPSTLKMNKAVRKYRNLQMALNGYKTVLNRSYLSVSDTREFENESGITLFHSISNVNERLPQRDIIMLLKKLGYYK